MLHNTKVYLVNYF